jgi:hypothetical protein
MPALHAGTSRVTLFGVPLLGLLLLGGLRCGEAPGQTGVRVTTTWSGGLVVEQLEYTMLSEQGAPASAPARRPAQAGGPLPSGVDVVVQVAVSQAGSNVRFRVRGLRGGQPVGAGESGKVLLQSGQVVDVTVVLQGAAGAMAVDAEVPPPDMRALVDASAGDALPPDRQVVEPRADATSIVEAAPSDVGVVRDVAPDAPAVVDAPLPDQGPGGDGPSGPVVKSLGEPCSAAGHCKSGFCVDGVCCETPCASLCLACNLPGKAGTCAFVPVGQKDKDCVESPVSTCGLDGTCDGRGGCRKYAAGTGCRPGTCAGASIVAPGTCDGNGACAPGPSVTCAPFLCDPSGAAPRCFGSCSDASQCLAGRSCEMGSCGKKFEGASCATDAECASGACADGVCCSSRCDGACVACNLPGNAGTCLPVADGVKDPRNSCADQGASTCGTDGTCDGRGKCAKYDAGAVCRKATCQSGSSLLAASRCDGLGNCLSGSEVACAPFVCSGDACTTTCTSASGCAGAACDATGSCGKRGNGQSCSDAAQCGSGFCVDGVCCGEACAGPCRSCAAGPAPGVCTAIAPGALDTRGMCPTQAPGTCGTDGTCDGAGACRKHPAGTECLPPSCSAVTNERQVASTCNGNGLCVIGARSSCGNYRCNGPTCFSACGADADCTPPNVCIGGTCGIKPTGSNCTKASECSTGNCVDGVCCQAATCGACAACNVPGSIGACAPVPAGGDDPRGTCAAQAASTCGTDGKCDGSGGCRKHPAGTLCVPAGCQADGVTLTFASTCDGAGSCQMGASQPCTPFRCDAATNACKTTCAGNGDCVSPNLCSTNNLCGSLKPLGQMCTAGAECASGNCVDGVCCSTATCASCKACNVTGQAGTCANVPLGTTDPRGVCATQAASTCGTDGKCDGAGACRRHPAGTVCLAGTCSSNVATPASTCNGNGTCVAPTSTINCGAYVCSAGICPSSCTSDAQCVSPNTCVGGICQKKPQGAACASAPQCLTGKCTNGVCCNSDNCGKCKACNVPGFLGVCSEVSAGTVDPSGTCTAELASTCDEDGTCDGAGSCRKYPLGTECAAGYCAGATLTRPRTCDGNGACKDRGKVNCSPYSCNAATLSCM